uniref:Uncharacterized protein n=1 Tax=Glossina palpalis gambiensis TaxID=67801 RepID=A0A1B0C6D8_9MUSC
MILEETLFKKVSHDLWGRTVTRRFPPNLERWYMTQRGGYCFFARISSLKVWFSILWGGKLANLLLLWLEWECADDGGVTAGIVAVDRVGNALKVGWQLSGGLSAPDLPAIVLVVAVEVVVGGPTDDGADEISVPSNFIWVLSAKYYDGLSLFSVFTLMMAASRKYKIHSFHYVLSATNSATSRDIHLLKRLENMQRSIEPVNLSDEEFCSHRFPRCRQRVVHCCW